MTDLAEMRAAILRAASTTLTSTRSEPSDPDDDDPDRLIFATLTTATKATSDNEKDEDEDDSVRQLAGTTTLTESLGDHERDQDDEDCAVDLGHVSEGRRRPLLYRFAETGTASNLNIDFDDTRQLSVLPDGRRVVDVLTAKSPR